jgi:hypothetical protein
MMEEKAEELRDEKRDLQLLCLFLHFLSPSLYSAMYYFAPLRKSDRPTRSANINTVILRKKEQRWANCQRRRVCCSVLLLTICSSYSVVSVDIPEVKGLLGTQEWM